MAPASVPTQPPSYHTHKGTSYITTVTNVSYFTESTTPDESYTWIISSASDVIEKERIEQMLRLENKKRSFDAIVTLAAQKPKVSDVCARQFFFRVIRQPKPKSRLRAKLYK